MSRGRLSGFAKFAWGVVAYNQAVIAWGAFVRASGSGAGCGSHWPMCNGEVIPHAPRVATMIELAHRASSGVALILVVALAVWAVRAFPRAADGARAPEAAAPVGALVRRGAVLSVVFILTEALIGAGLVLFELVAHDASMKRALSISLHLTNTFILLACLTLTALWASGGPRPRLRGCGKVLAVLGPALAGALVLGTSGAVAALGDTLFPVRSIAEGFAQDFSPTAHLFVRVRVLHPFIAAGLGVYVVLAATATRWMRPTPRVKGYARALVVAFVAQFALGLLNLALLAPVAIQLAHLLLADVVWLLLVVLTASALDESPTSESTQEITWAHA